MIIKAVVLVTVMTNVDTKQILTKKSSVYEKHPEKCFEHAEFLNNTGSDGYLDKNGKYWKLEFKCMGIGE